MVATSRGFLKPPPSPPSTTSPSTPASIAFWAPRSVGTTWKTVRPACLRRAQYLAGSPAEVVTNLTPCSTTKSTMPGSRTNACAMLTPKGLSVRSRILRISSRISSRRPEEVSMMPIAPALETAEASWARAIHPIGACTMGTSTPRRSVTRLRIFMGLPPVAGGRILPPCGRYSWRLGFGRVSSRSRRTRPGGRRWRPRRSATAVRSPPPSIVGSPSSRSPPSCSGPGAFSPPPATPRPRRPRSTATWRSPTTPTASSACRCSKATATALTCSTWCRSAGATRGRSIAPSGITG